MRNLDNSEDILDSRDIEARIDELTAERDGFREAVEEAQEAFNAANATDDTEEGRELGDALAMARKELADWQASDDPAELATLVAFRDELKGYCDDWTHGVTLIRDSYFKEYAMELADECSNEKPSEAGWPFNCIDWNKAARELQMDYTSGEFDGVTYWAR